MKKITLLALFSIAILSCQNPKEKETSQDNNKVIIGYDITEGKKNTALLRRYDDCRHLGEIHQSA